MALLAFTTLGCAYRFSNRYARVPANVKTIAVEAVYDTSGLVRPHELLWESVQKAFAANGRLHLTSADRADAYLQIQLYSAGDAQHSEVKTGQSESPDFDPASPTSPDAFPSMALPDNIADKETQRIGVAIKIWDLRTKSLLFQKTYERGADYRILDNSATQETKFLRANEAMRKNFKDMADQVASAVVRDFLRG